MKSATLFTIAALALSAGPASAQPAGQGHGMQVPRPGHYRVNRPDRPRLVFMREHPCPATGVFTVDCPGWRVEFIVPPERGGKDEPANMRWERTDVTRPAG